jgi:hypothetical protein
MSSYDKVTMSLPNGDTFTATGELQVTERQQPFYLLDGFQRIRTLAEQVGVLDSDTSQAFLGTGARVRTWQVSFVQWEGSSDDWGSAAADDDVLTKLNILGNSLANAGIDGGNTATLEYGEYSTPGQFSPQSVVPGEIELPADLSSEGSPSTFSPSLEWRDAADLNEAIHGLAP